LIAFHLLDWLLFSHKTSFIVLDYSVWQRVYKGNYRSPNLAAFVTAIGYIENPGGICKRCISGVADKCNLGRSVDNKTDSVLI